MTGPPSGEDRPEDSQFAQEELCRTDPQWLGVHRIGPKLKVSLFGLEAQRGEPASGKDLIDDRPLCLLEIILTIGGRYVCH